MAVPTEAQMDEDRDPSEAPGRVGEPSGPRADDHPLEGVRVLLVDDDAPLALVLSRALARRGLIVETAHDGPSARQQLSQSSFDALVMDLRMTGEDGVSVYDSVRGTPGVPPAVLYSAFLDIPTTVRALRAGFHDVLEKPVPLEQLEARLRAIVSGGGGEVTDSPAEPVSASGRLIGGSEPMQALRAEIARVGGYGDVSVLVVGETGTGKELVARALHEVSGRKGPFVAINCAAIPDNLVEAELFGHEAGAYTGAHGSSPGLMEQAAGGTLFLDEIGEMAPALQAKLLRVLEARVYRRVGGRTDRQLDVRVVSATNRSPDDPALREDLFYRLAGYLIRTPPLRAHLSDVPALAQAFVSAFARRSGLPARELTRGALATLGAHTYPGNVRELRAIVEHALVMADGADVDEDAVRWVLSARGAGGRADEPTLPASTAGPRQAASLPELERQVTCEAFDANERNLSQTARVLGIPRTTLRDRLKRYGLL